MNLLSHPFAYTHFNNSFQYLSIPCNAVIACFISCSKTINRHIKTQTESVMLNMINMNDLLQKVSFYFLGIVFLKRYFIEIKFHI